MDATYCSFCPALADQPERYFVETPDGRRLHSCRDHIGSLCANPSATFADLIGAARQVVADLAAAAAHLAGASTKTMLGAAGMVEVLERLAGWRAHLARLEAAEKAHLLRAEQARGGR